MPSSATVAVILDALALILMVVGTLLVVAMAFNHSDQTGITVLGLVAIVLGIALGRR